MRAAHLHYKIPVSLYPLNHKWRKWNPISTLCTGLERIKVQESFDGIPLFRNHRTGRQVHWVRARLFSHYGYLYCFLKDWRWYLSDMVENHPGLEFLFDYPIFQQRYSMSILLSIAANQNYSRDCGYPFLCRREAETNVNAFGNVYKG